MDNNKFILSIILLLLFINLSAQEKPTEINLQLKWLHQFQFAGYYAALEKGFYKDAGLSVNLKEGFVDINPYEEVLSGRADFSISNSNIIIERAKGNSLIVLANIFQHSPEALMVRGDSGINTVTDLIGKKIMIDLETGLVVRALLKNEGVSESAFELLEHDHEFTNLIENKVDAMACYLTDQPFLLLQNNIPYKILNPVNYGIDFYGDCLFTSEKFIEENPVITKKFLDATILGWQYAMENKEEIVDLILGKYNPKINRERLLFEADAMETLMQPKFIEIGHMNKGRWKHIADTFEEFGVLAGEVDIGGLIYNPNPEFNKQPYYWIGGILLVIILGGVIGTVILLRFNTRLQEEVKAQTAELKEAKDKAEKSEILKTEFLAQMSHEIRSPINTILSFATLIKDEVTSQSSDWNDLFESMESAGQRIIRTIDLLLNMSEIQTGSYEVNPRKIKLYDEIIYKIYSEYKIEAEKKKLKLELNLISDCGVIWADEYSISQVFANLIDNSIKYTDTGKIEIECTRENGNLVVNIKDSGIGISEEYLPKLFSSFTQEEQGYTRTFEGNGLGLALVKNYCDMNNAVISVKSEKGKGSVFTVVIPEAV